MKVFFKIAPVWEVFCANTIKGLYEKGTLVANLAKN